MINDDLTKEIIACTYKVHNTLGSGYLEKVYENAMMIELKKAELKAQQQFNIPVYYDNIMVGDFFANIIVENKVILELKAIENLTKFHEVQLVNYLKGTGIQIGLLINFGRSIEIKRKYKDYIIND